MEEIAIIGVGLHPWGKFPEKFWTNMAADAAHEALADAGITWSDMQTVVSGSQNWGGRKGIYSGNYFDEVMGYNGVPTLNVNNACATGGTCITVAAAMVASGYADVALAVSADKSAKGFFPFLPPYHEEPVPADDTMRWLMGLPNPDLLGARVPQEDGEVRHHRRAPRSGQGRDEQARCPEPDGPLPQGVHSRGSPRVADGHRPAEALRDLRDQRRGRRGGPVQRQEGEAVHDQADQDRRSGSGQSVVRRPHDAHPGVGLHAQGGRAHHQRELGRGSRRLRAVGIGPRGHRLRRGPRQQLVALLPVPRDHGLLRGGHRAPRARSAARR